MPTELSQGIFWRTGRYPAVMRFSPASIRWPTACRRDVDWRSKIIGDRGERLPGSEADTTQNFVLANRPAFSSPSARDLFVDLKVLAKTTDRAEALKEALSPISSKASCRSTATYLSVAAS
jgi:hypothetical protein